MSWGDTMGDISRDMMNRFRRGRIRARRYTAGFLAAATLVGCGVGWGLRQTGISATADTFCGAEEHTHTQQCYEKVLVCGMEEGETLPTQAPHVHEESCYGLQKICVCGTEAHAHSDACYAMQRNLTCTSGEHSHGDACYTTSGGELTCAAAEHTHSDECKDAEGNLTCDQQEHSHGDGCFSPVERTLSCTLTEHTHDDSCYGDAEKVLICGHGEHEHTDACYEEQQVLVCTLSTEPEAQTPHVHAEACYEERRICGKEEHSHTDQCMSDPTADVEDADAWSANACNPGGGVWAADLLGVASAQLGYAESQRNFRVDENGIRRGYTRYGAWYGDPYGSWNGMFLAYCLHFAGVPESAVSQRAGVSALLADLSGSDRLKNPDDYTPQPGDIAVFGDRVGVIREAGETLSVICGDVDGIVAELSVAPSSISKYIKLAEISVAAYSVKKNAQAALTGETGSNSGASAQMSDYVQSIVLTVNGKTYTINKGGSVPTVEMNQGDNITFRVNFNLPNNTYPGTYDIDGISLNNDITPTVFYHDTTKKEVGKYSISTAGVITLSEIIPENMWENGADFTGYIAFDGIADLLGSDENYSMNFPGFGSIPVTPRKEANQTDFSKTVVANADGSNYSVNEDGKIVVTYKVTVSQRKGDGTEKITIKDHLNDQPWDHNIQTIMMGSFVDGSISLRKNTSNESSNLPVDASARKTDENGKDMIEVSDLEPLMEGESYELSYSVVLPSDVDRHGIGGTACNWAEYQGDTSSNSSYWLDYKSYVEKGGHYNESTGRIDWSIKLDSPKGSLAGKTLKDIFENGETEIPGQLTSENVVGDITITGSNGFSATISKDELFGGGYTIRNDNRPFTIMYSTTVPASSEITSYKNKATLDDKFWDEAEVTVTPGQWRVAKALKSSDLTNSKLTWSLDVINSGGASNFTVTDVISDAYKKDDSTTISASHYGIQSEIKEAIEKGLYVILADGKETRIDYKDFSDKITVMPSYKEIDGDEETGAISGFTLSFLCQNGTDPIKSVHIPSYETHIRTANIPVSVDWVFKNTATVENKAEGSATYEYRKTVPFKKRVSIKWNDYQEKVEGVFGQIDQLRYQIELTTDAKQTEDIRITDQLPVGLKFNYFQYTIDNQYVSNVCQLENYTAAVEEGRLNFVISGYNTDGKSHSILITYSVTYDSDPRWNDPSVSSVSYINTAHMGDEESTAEATISRNLAKTAVIGTGARSNEIQYTVVINPAGERLNNGNDIWLKDNMSPGGVSWSVDKDDIKLYKLHKDENGNILLSEANRVPFTQIQFDLDKADWLRILVSDEQAYVLTYTVKLVRSTVTQDTTINNTVALEGITSTTRGVSAKKLSSDAGGDNGMLTIYKQDKDTGVTITSSEATFEIRSFDKNTAVWSEEKMTFTTTGGKISIPFSDNQQNAMRQDILYRIVEVASPDGYKLDPTPRYLIFSNESTKSEALKIATGLESVPDCDEGRDAITDQSVLLKISKPGTQQSIQVDNHKMQLTVNKQWLFPESDTQNIIPVQAIEVKLYRHIEHGEEQEVVGKGATLMAPAWSYSWDDLEKTDVNGNPYLYSVKEVILDGYEGQWTVNYLNNDINSGIITIQNSVNIRYSYELPNTGGTGTRNYVLFGTLAMILAGCGMIVTRKKHDIGVNEK